MINTKDTFKYSKAISNKLGIYYADSIIVDIWQTLQRPVLCYRHHENACIIDVKYNFS